MIKKILLVLALIFIVLAIVISTRPADFRITRSETMAASPAAVFEQVNDFHKWEAWSPWQKMDPSMKMTYEGPASGKGAIYGWSGNSKVGEGKMTIIESQPAEHIGMQLDFIKPMPGTNLADFNFKPEGGNTNVTWTMTGRYNFIARAIGLFMNMDKMIGDQFAQGLAQMKTIVETKAK